MRGRRPKESTKRSPLATGAPECPDWLDAMARAEWSRVVPDLEASGALCQADLGILASYCQTFARWRQCEAELTAAGCMLVGNRINPAAKHAENLCKLLRSLAAELGLTPASRGRLGDGDATNGQAAELAEFITGGKS